MKSLISLAVLPIASVLLVGCASSDSAREPTGEELSALCAGAPLHNDDGTVTQSGCLFEQQLINIARSGTQLETRTLVDAEGQIVANVNLKCGSWYSGADSTGVTVTIDSSTGEVRSHGAFHPGQTATGLAASVATPVTLK